eukprot:SAG11_NODE_4275_length_1972_cov_1.985585_1_plen_107_part_10
MSFTESWTGTTLICQYCHSCITHTAATDLTWHQSSLVMNVSAMRRHDLDLLERDRKVDQAAAAILSARKEARRAVEYVRADAVKSITEMEEDAAEEVRKWQHRKRAG